MRAIMLAAALVLAGAACGSDDAERIVVGAVDSGTEVQLDGGQELDVRLESNPTTGFGWVVEPVPEMVRLVSSGFEAPDTDLVGAPGIQVFVFEATAGAGVLRFEYRRPFENEPAQRIVEFLVRVDDAAWPPVDATTPGTSRASAPGTTTDP